MKARLFVITGGPGAGKTTLCAALAERGVAITPESGRAVIKEQTASGGRALPWVDPSAYAGAIFARDLTQYEAAALRPGLSLFDRGFPDNAAYLAMLGLPITAALDAACQSHRYAEPVFVAPPWEEIYTQDAERKQDWA